MLLYTARSVLWHVKPLRWPAYTPDAENHAGIHAWEGRKQCLWLLCI